MTKRPPQIFVLTGAGVSAESGLGTFRDKDGLWAKFNPYELAMPEAFARDPAKVHAFYNLRRKNLLDAAPNAAHAALARLQRGLTERGGVLTLVTQNVDDLHERGGSTDVIHMHGELLKARCTSCRRVAAWRDDLAASTSCPTCGVTGGMRPHIVWFGEVPLGMHVIEERLSAADLFVAIGTSGAVYPAAGFVELASAHGARTLELNLEPSDGAQLFDEGRYGPASEIVPAWVEDVLRD
jgi:NAD-dependent deacetylase